MVATPVPAHADKPFTNARRGPRPPLQTARLYLRPRKLFADPIGTIERAAQQAGGDIVRLDLGLVRPFLFVKPEHVQRVLRDNAGNYVREGVFWETIRRLVGNGIFTEGENWAISRKLMGPLFSARQIEAQLDTMAAAISEAADDLAVRARGGAEVDTAAEMVRFVHRAVFRAFFGDRISVADSDRLAPALDDAATSILWRLVLPFVPKWFPLPGDREFFQATKMINGIMLPLIEQSRRDPSAGRDILTTLVRAESEDGNGMSDQMIRDNVVSMFAAGTETTGVALTWLWVVLHQHPDVAARVYEEVDRVVGGGPVRAAHIRELEYTRMVLQELLRLYGIAWLMPRLAANDDVVDGVRIPRGSTIMISPHFTHRMDFVWDRPLEFDPERFTTRKAEGRHRLAYFPFGHGSRLCLGQHLFLAEAQLIVASVLSRWRPQLTVKGPVTPMVAATLRPRKRVTMRLVPAR